MPSEQVSDVAVQFAPAVRERLPTEVVSVDRPAPCALTKVKSAAVRLEAGHFAWLKVNVAPTSEVVASLVTVARSAGDEVTVRAGWVFQVTVRSAGRVTSAP
ncbi:MAG: hypothetical protein IPQ07_02225 [Myxococcales bacterium]|nr:hypothetical protein [Myxococcales bacterium]